MNVHHVVIAVLLGLSVEAGAAASQQGHWTLRPDKTFPEAPEAPLTRVWDMALGPDGNVYVVDVSGIQVFTKDGDFLRQIGQKQRGFDLGPGDFASVSGIGFLGDSLWATDDVIGRVTLFSLDGTVLDTWLTAERLSLSEASLPFRPFSVMASDAVLVVENNEYFDMDLYGEAGAELKIVDSEAQLVGNLPFLDPTGAYMVALQPPSTRLQARQPFAFSDMLKADPFTGKVVVLRRPVPVSDEAGSYVLTGYGPDGRQLFQTEHEYRPVQLLDRDVDAWVDSILALSRESPRLPHRVKREMYRKNLYRPGYYPPIHNRLLGVFRGPLAFDRDGSVWIQRTSFDSKGLWDVFDAQGVYKGTAQSPENVGNVQLFVIGGGTAWGVRYDEYRVPYVVRLRVEETEGVSKDH